MAFVVAGGHRLEYRWFFPALPRASAPAIVMLHEGLGSLSMWRDFPQRLADACGAATLAYSRWGYGASEAITAKRPVDFMHREALDTLPELLHRLDIRRPILFGHSDGGSIALIHAAAGHETAGLIVLAPHLFVEDRSIESIEAAREAWHNTDLRQRLMRHHNDVEGAFRGWNDIWLDPAFRGWNIEAEAARITVPILAIQGLDDEYGTPRQVQRIAELTPDAEVLLLADCRHSPHRDQGEAVLEASLRFVLRVLESQA
jgi:pimeloyl-ACP methyl ester carboxylesterase